MQRTGSAELTCDCSICQETASSPLPYKDLEAMAARVNGPAGDSVAAETSDPEPALVPPPQSSPTASSVDMELTGPCWSQKPQLIAGCGAGKAVQAVKGCATCKECCAYHVKSRSLCAPATCVCRRQRLRGI